MKIEATPIYGTKRTRRIYLDEPRTFKVLNTFEHRWPLMGETETLHQEWVVITEVWSEVQDTSDNHSQWPGCWEHLYHKRLIEPTPPTQEDLKSERRAYLLILTLLALLMITLFIILAHQAAFVAPENNPNSVDYDPKKERHCVFDWSG